MYTVYFALCKLYSTKLIKALLIILTFSEDYFFEEVVDLGKEALYKKRNQNSLPKAVN